MILRLATQDDVPRLLEMGLRFLREGPYKSLLPENQEQMGKIARDILESPQGRVVVAQNGAGPVGMLAFAVFTHPLSGETIGGELVWWVDPEHRKGSTAGMDLLKLAEQAAKDLGARKFQMIAPDKKLDSLYRRKGYTEVETTYQKELE